MGCCDEELQGNWRKVNHFSPKSESHARLHATWRSHYANQIQATIVLKVYRSTIPDISIRQVSLSKCLGPLILTVTPFSPSQWYLNLKCCHCSLDTETGTWAHTISFALHFEHCGFITASVSYKRKLPHTGEGITM